MSILKYLYPVPREDSKRILTFANHDDYISFRHHTYKKVKLNYEIFNFLMQYRFTPQKSPWYVYAFHYRQKMAKTLI